MARGKKKQDHNPVSILLDGGKYKLTADSSNWILSEQKVTGKKEVIYTNERFYPSLPSVLRAVLDLKLRNCGAASFADLTRLHHEFNEALRSQFEEAVHA
jgi:hypothetical protein